MTEPRHKKYEYYKDYYKETGCVPHDILIDENNRMVDGYIDIFHYLSPISMEKV